MTQTHPIPPPLGLVEQWFNDSPIDRGLTLATQAAQWGADQELEACANYIDNNMSGNKAREFRAIRRPKPPSLKEQALETLRSMQIDPVVINGVNLNAEVMAKYDTIRRALEQLPN